VGYSVLKELRKKCKNEKKDGKRRKGRESYLALGVLEFHRSLLLKGNRVKIREDPPGFNKYIGDEDHNKAREQRGNIDHQLSFGVKRKRRGKRGQKRERGAKVSHSSSPSLYGMCGVAFIARNIASLKGDDERETERRAFEPSFRP